MAISSTKWLAALLLTAGSVACAVERQTESPALATAPVEDEDLDVDVGSLETNDTVDALAGDIDLVPSGRAVNGLVPLVTPTFVAAFQRLELSSGVVGENARLLELPLGLTTADVRLPANDPLDPSLAELGNLLFFDARLSAGSKIACATCHVPSHGFASTQIDVGVLGTRMVRTTPPAMNRAFGTENNWLGERTLEAQSTAPITNPLEMGLTEAQLVSVVSGIPGYAERFDHLVRAGRIGAPAVSLANVQHAIATFQRTLMTGNSRVDQYEAGFTSALSADEIAGRELFRGRARCSLCHSGPNYTDESYHNIASGCPSGGGTCTHPTSGFEAGRYEVTRNGADIGKFKTPSLRNVGLRGPYFHRGIDATLESVLTGYNTAANLDAEIGQDPLLIQLGLEWEEEQQIIAFLRALSGNVEISAAMSVPGTAGTSSLRERYLLSPEVFDTAFYRSRNPDLAFMSDDQLRDHWITFGAKEGRRATATFLVKEYDTLMAGSAPGWVRGGPQGTYVPAIMQYLDRGRRTHPLFGRYTTHPGFFEYRQYRQMNAARLGLTPYKGVVRDFLSFGIGNKLAGRRTYLEGSRFRLADVTGKDYTIKSGTYCESPQAAGPLPIWPYLPPNLPFAGVCR